MEVEGEDEFREEYACPFCSDYFDIVSLCCHIDEDHPMDTINGITSWGLRRWSSYFLEDGRILTTRYTVRAFCMRHYEKISCCVIVRGDKAMQLLECGLKVKEYRSNL
ncbi:protein DEHYDRATION-INDUCED 19 homolog 5-like [Brassica rapa]|uniref:protein DEHYDRATION-INDUCED 19 homolog 5-like n=1 Tax=Brassica campestris TaxID=3711 RepID=UPI0006AA9938|nr:protein DEHYDRATION-INDUCED 19 homolog 5-like [Brassica rapa]